MRLIGNILWLLLGGLGLAVSYLLAGIFFMVLVITIPFGVQSFKLAGYSLWPFGRAVVQRPDRSASASCAGNVLWILLAGWWLAIAHALCGVILMITIIGIPFGVAHFKLAGLALTPFGAEVVGLEEARGQTVIVQVSPLDR